jgi:hypothetical protein
VYVGDSGVELIHYIVTKMGFEWRERKRDGVDGEIDVANHTVDDTARHVILVRCRARDRSFSGENDRGFEYLCSPSDVNHWMSGDLPVLVICCHPRRGAAWWVHAQTWFKDPEHRASGRIHFSRRTQRFNASAAHRLVALLDSTGES